MSKKVSLSTAILMIMNIMVGSGILIGPAQMAAIAGNASFLGWFVAALIFLPIVLCITKLSRLFPGKGGFYAYAKGGLGEQLGLTAGLIYLIGYTLAAITEVVALRGMVLRFDQIAWLAQSNILFNFALVAVIVGLNLLTITTFGRIINSFTIAKLLPLMILICLIPFVLQVPFPITGQELAAAPFCIFPMAIFGYFGFEYACSMSHLIEHGEKNAPRAIMIGFLGTAVLYALFHFGLLNLMGVDNLVHAGAESFAEFIQLPVPYLSQFLALLIPTASMITLFAAANGMVNVNALLMHAMADLTKAPAVAWLTPLSAWGRPWIAVLTQGLIIFTMATIIPSLSFVASLTNVAILFSFVLPLLSLILLQRRERVNSGALLFTILTLLLTLGLTLYSFYGLW